MAIVPYGSQNTTAQIVPDVLTQIVPPQAVSLNGVPSNAIGVVGSATFGPVGKPVIVSDMASYQRAFGTLQNRKYDMGTILATAVQQGANNFVCVRVTDGTDAAATYAYTPQGEAGPSVTFTGKYTGSKGNAIRVFFGTGSKASTIRVTVSIPGERDEVYDNLPAAGASFYPALRDAINLGKGVRSASDLVVATLGASVVAPTLNGASLALVGGSDGASSVTATHLLGADASRTGMYALRNQGVSVAVLADCDTASSWTTQAGFGLEEGIYFVTVGVSGQSIADSVAAKSTAGLDSYAVKHMHGDLLYWNDPVNGVQRLVSPQGFVAGRLGNLAPHLSTLNEPLFGIVGSQKVGQVDLGGNAAYSKAELAALFLASIDVVTNPAPGGKYWAVRGGHNSSSSKDVDGDNYTRMVNYVAKTIDSAMGKYCGKPANEDTMLGVTASLENFLGAMVNAGQLERGAYSVKCDASNNPRNERALGYLKAEVKVRLTGIVEFLVLNVEIGQTVIINQA